MRIILRTLALMVLTAFPSLMKGQFTPPANLLYTNVGGVPTAVTSTLTSGQISYTPPSILAKCMNGTLIVDCDFSGGGGATTFDLIGSGTNTNHGLVVGNGSVLTTAGTGFINANEINGGTIPSSAAALGTNSSGQPVPVTLNPSTCVSNTTGNKCLGVSPYLAVAGDWTTALQQAITDVTTDGGGNIYAPCGTFPLNGPLQDTGGANAIITMPHIPYSTASNTPAVSISIIGCSVPASANSTAGTIFTTTLSSSTGSLIGGYYNTGPYAPFTNVWLNLKNLRFRSYDNPNLVMVNATNIVAIHSEHLWFDTGATSITDPTHTNSAAMLYPIVGNNVSLSMEDISAVGYYRGFVLTEHTQASSIYVANCHDAFVLDSGVNSGFPTYVGNSISIDYAWALSCHNGISAGSNPTTVNAQNIDIELPTNFTINDPGNLLQGQISFTNPYSTQYSLTSNGAANVQLIDLPYPTIGFSGGFGLNGGSASNGTLGWYANSHTANVSITNPEIGELQVNGNNPNSTFVVNSTLQPSIFGVQTSCATATCYAASTVGTFPNWIRTLSIPSTATFGGIFKINSGLVATGAGATNGLILNTETTAPVSIATNSTIRMTIDGTTGNAAFTGAITSAGNAVLAPVSNTITSATGGTGISAVTCSTATCTNLRGTYTMTATTVSAGTILTLVWPTTTTAYACSVTQNGGAISFGLGHSVATSTGMSVTVAVTITSGSITFDYSCEP